MDTKLKIVLIVFVCVAVGYAIYFVLSDFSKDAKETKIKKNITESYEDYDIRKNILSQLDNYNIDKKAKNAVYEVMNKNIEKFKDMPEYKMEEFIKEVVADTKKSLKSATKKASAKSENSKEKRGEDVKGARRAKHTDDSDAEDFEEDDKKEDFLDPPSNSGVSTSSQEIQHMLDTASSQLSSIGGNIMQLKSLVDKMTSECTTKSTATTKTTGSSIQSPPFSTAFANGSNTGVANTGVANTGVANTVNSSVTGSGLTGVSNSGVSGSTLQLPPTSTANIAGPNTLPSSGSTGGSIVTTGTNLGATGTKSTIEGFENFSGRGFSFI